MSWLSQGIKKLGRAWDTTVGRDGLAGWVGDTTGLWQSGYMQDRIKVERDKLGDYIGGMSGREEGINKYYNALGAMYQKDTGARASNLSFTSRTQNQAIETQGQNKMSMLNLVSHTGVKQQTDEALKASNFQWGSQRAALDRDYAMKTLTSDKARTGELQNLSDMLYQLNQQHKNLGG